MINIQYQKGDGIENTNVEWRDHSTWLLALGVFLADTALWMNTIFYETRKIDFMLIKERDGEDRWIYAGSDILSAPRSV